uniref:GB1/RHD3-type G domain-containing protein n=1 Tax=Anolis carolinensis TaxID=28377 RepID=R4GBX1_ANOCA
MNRLAGKRTGFSLGSTVQANTKGIWMWCVPYPDRKDQTLVLLDTEGLGDVDKGDTQNDTWIFALAVLLSSTLVYNSMGTIDQNAMDQLHYVTELTERIKAKYLRFFPSFAWALRDFTLQLELNGRPITEDEYLENALKLKKGDSPDVRLFNLPRKCIRFFFPTRKCFIFDRPTSRKNLHRLEQMEERELEPDFVEQADRFCNYIFWTSKEKTLPGGHVVTGHLLAKLVETYVETISSGKVPCMESAVLALAKMENAAAVEEALARYGGLMGQRLCLPTESVPELLGVHAECEKEALQVFMARAFKDDAQRFQVKLMAEAALQQFLESKEAVGRAILQSDTALSEKEKQMEEAQEQAVAAQREKEVLRQRGAELEQKMQDKQRSYEENIQQLKVKMEQDREQLLEEQKKMMDSRLGEQEALLREGFQKEAKRMQEEVQRLREQSASVKEPSWMEKAMDGLLTVGSLFLPGIAGKAVGLISNLFRRL